MPNYFAKDGALELRERIRKYWSDRGYEAEVEVVATEYDAKVRSIRYDVRSQMLNGLPRRRTAA